MASQYQPDFENLQMTLLNQSTGPMPLIELGIDPSIKSKILNRRFESTGDDIEFMQQMGYDFVKIQPVIDLFVNRKSAGGGAVADRSWSAEHDGIITDWAAFEKYDWPGVEDISYEKFENAREQLPENMGIIGQYGDIYTTVWEMMGFETFAMAIYEDPELVKALFEKVSHLILNMFDTMASMDWVGALWYSDDIAYSSGLMVHPDFLRQYFFPLLSHIGQLAEKRSIPFIYHTDGKLWDIMDDIIASGVNALHPIEPKSMDIFEVSEKVGDRLCLCGGVDVDLLTRGTSAEIEKHTLNMIERMSTGAGYCAGSSNSIPEYVPVENYLKMVETVRHFRSDHGF